MEQHNEKTARLSDPDWRARFVEMLPEIRCGASRAFRGCGTDLRQELIAEVVARCFVAYHRLVERDLEHQAFATVLARFAIAHVRRGIQVGSRRNLRDVTSWYSRLRSGLVVQSLHTFDADSDEWRELLVEDRTATPADIAITRIDVAAWLLSLPHRIRQIAETLATGEQSRLVAQQFGVTTSRISQLRRELARSWSEFQGPRHDRDLKAAVS